MPIIHVTTWTGQPKTKSRELMNAITKVVHEVTSAPLDKITVYISEIPKENWMEGASLGADPDFPTQSRRLRYDVES